jgi:hypothetical protein
MYERSASECSRAGACQAASGADGTSAIPATTTSLPIEVLGDFM